MLVTLQVLDKLVNARSQKGNLYFRRTSIILMNVILVHYSGLFSLFQRHAPSPFQFVTFQTWAHYSTGWGIWQIEINKYPSGCYRAHSQLKESIDAQTRIE